MKEFELYVTLKGMRNMSMIKMLFSDLDGTLLYHNGNHSDPVTEENLQAIEKLEASGVKFGIATSRSHVFLSKKMNKNKQFDTVAFNGNLVVCGNQIVDAVTFTKEEIKAVLQAMKADSTDNRSMLITRDNDVIFYDIRYPRAQGYVENKLNFVQDHRFILSEKAPDYIEHSSEQICMMIGVFPNQELCDKSRAEMKEIPGVQYTDTSERTFTVTKGHRDKVTGILKIAEMYGLLEDEIAVIGDSYNDVEMMRRFKHSFCMSHAPEEIKKQASDTVESVAECILKILESNRRKHDETV